MSILYLTQALNAVLLLPLLVLVFKLSRDPVLRGGHSTGTAASAAQLLTIVLLAACVAVLLGATPGAWR